MRPCVRVFVCVRACMWSLGGLWACAVVCLQEPLARKAVLVVLLTDWQT